MFYARSLSIHDKRRKDSNDCRNHWSCPWRSRPACFRSLFEYSLWFFYSFDSNRGNSIKNSRSCNYLYGNRAIFMGFPLHIYDVFWNRCWLSWKEIQSWVSEFSFALRSCLVRLPRYTSITRRGFKAMFLHLVCNRREVCFHHLCNMHVNSWIWVCIFARMAICTLLSRNVPSHFRNNQFLGNNHFDRL